MESGNGYRDDLRTVGDGGVDGCRMAPVGSRSRPAAAHMAWLVGSRRVWHSVMTEGLLEKGGRDEARLGEGLTSCDEILSGKIPEDCFSCAGEFRLIVYVEGPLQRCKYIQDHG